jgi:hypothetical protein
MLRRRAPTARRALRGLRGAPLRKEARDECMFIVPFDGQSCQRRRNGESSRHVERPTILIVSQRLIGSARGSPVVCAENFVV